MGGPIRQVSDTRIIRGNLGTTQIVPMTAGMSGKPIQIFKMNLPDEQDGDCFCVVLLPPDFSRLTSAFGAVIKPPLLARIEISGAGAGFPVWPGPVFYSAAAPVPVALPGSWSIEVDWRRGCVIPVPAGEVRLSVFPEFGVLTQGNIMLSAYITKGGKPHATPGATCTRFVTSLYAAPIPPAVLPPFATQVWIVQVPPFAYEVQFETSQFTTRSILVHAVNAFTALGAGGVLAERNWGPNIEPTPFLLPGGTDSLVVTNDGNVNIDTCCAIFKLAL